MNENNTNPRLTHPSVVNPDIIGLSLRLAVVLFGVTLFSVTGCGLLDAFKDAPADSSAAAGLDIWVEVDWHVDESDAIQSVLDWQSGILQGPRSGDCTFRFPSTPALNVVCRMGDQYVWSRSMKELVFDDFGGETKEDVMNYVMTLKTHRDADHLPNPYVMLAHHLEDPALFNYGTSSVLPVDANFFGMVRHPPVRPESPSELCDYWANSPHPSGVVFVGAVRKMGRESNDWFERHCGTGMRYFDIGRLVDRAVWHELFHEIAIADPDPSSTGNLLCHDGDQVCRCVMNGLQYAPALTQAYLGNCTFAKQMAESLVSNCIGEAGNEWHYDNGCDYAELNEFNPDD